MRMFDKHNTRQPTEKMSQQTTSSATQSTPRTSSTTMNQQGNENSRPAINPPIPSSTNEDQDQMYWKMFVELMGSEEAERVEKNFQSRAPLQKVTRVSELLN